jgi:hypothetical protein
MSSFRQEIFNMKRYPALICLLFLLAVSCGPADHKRATETTRDSTEDKQVTGLAPGSYQYCFVTADDTAILTLRVSDGGVDGTLLLQYFGKERNDGKLENAYFRKDTLIADYRYWSEIGQSLREVLFLINDDTAREGFGPQADSSGKRIFNSHNEVLFNGPVMSADGCGKRVPTFKKPEKKG